MMNHKELMTKRIKNPSMLRSSLYHYSDVYILAKGTVIVGNIAAQ